MMINTFHKRLQYLAFLALSIVLSGCLFDNNEIVPIEDEWAGIYHYPINGIYQLHEDPKGDGYYVFASIQGWSPLNQDFIDLPFIVKVDKTGAVTDTIIGTASYSPHRSLRYWVKVVDKFYMISGREGATTITEFHSSDHSFHDINLSAQLGEEAHIVGIGNAPENALLLSSKLGNYYRIDILENVTVTTKVTMPISYYLSDESVFNSPNTQDSVYIPLNITSKIYVQPDDVYAVKIGYYTNENGPFIYSMQARASYTFLSTLGGETQNLYSSAYALFQVSVHDSSQIDMALFIPEESLSVFDGNYELNFSAFVLGGDKNHITVASKETPFLYPHIEANWVDAYPGWDSQKVAANSTNGIPVSEYNTLYPILLRYVECQNQTFILYIGTTQGGGVLISVFDALSGKLIGKKNIITANQPYVAVDFIQTQNDGFTICGYTSLANRRDELFLMKFSEVSLKEILQ